MIVLVFAAVTFLSIHVSPAHADRAEIVARSKAATVMVHVSGYGSGSGFCVSADGFFVTNYHVIASVGIGSFVDLVLQSGEPTEQVVKARVVSTDPENDLALLKAEGVKGPKVLKLGGIADLVETTPLTTYGFPFGRMLAIEGNLNPSISVNTGRISSLRKLDGKLRAIQLDAAVNPGNSGGPVIDEKGEVIGVVVSGVRTARVSFAIPVNMLKEFLSKPGLIMDVPPIRFRDRHAVRRFQIEAFSLQNSAKPQTVDLVLRNEDGDERKLKARPDGKNFFVEAAPVVDPGTPLKLRVTVQRSEKIENVDIADQTIQMGSRKFSLLEVRKIEKRPNLHILVTADGEKIAGNISGLKKIKALDGPTLNLESAERIDFHVHNPGPVQIQYGIVGSQDNQAVTTSFGIIDFTHVPQKVPEHPFVVDDPFAPLIDEITIDAFITGKSNLYITPEGLLWDHKSQRKPGATDDQGTYVVVNDRKWYLNWYNPNSGESGADVSVTYPIKIGNAAWGFKLLSVREKRDGENNPKRGKVEHKYDEQVPEQFIVSIDDTAEGAAWYQIRLSRRGRTSTRPIETVTPAAVATSSGTSSSVPRPETPELTGVKLRARLAEGSAKVKVLSDGKFLELRDGAKPYGNTKPNHLWKAIPKTFLGMNYFQSPNYHGNRLMFEIEAPGLVVLATTTRWGGGGSVSRDLAAEMDSREDLLRQGWRPFEATLEGETGWAIFYRECAMGESFSIRTEKYNPPTIFLSSASAPKPDSNPTPSTPTTTKVPTTTKSSTTYDASSPAGVARKLLSERGAEVTVATRGKIRELREGEHPYHGSKESQIFKPIPAHFAGLKFFQVHSAYQGTIEVEIKTSGIMVIATCHRGAGAASISEASRKQLQAEGWEEFEGNLVSHLTWATFYRECKAGEVLKLSTDKYYAPVVLLPESVKVEVP